MFNFIKRPYISINVHSVILTFKYRSINTLTSTTGGLVAFKLVPFFVTLLLSSIYFSLRSTVGTGGGDGGAINSTLDLTTLKHMLDEIDLHRRNLMFNFHQAAELARANLIILNNGYSSFVQIHPDLAENLDSLRNSLDTVSNWNGSGEVAKIAQEFETVIAPLDNITTELGNIISVLDPDWVAYDTDEEMIADAAEDMARRARSGNYNSNIKPGGPPR